MNYLRIPLDNIHPLYAMQLLPAAIEYKNRATKEGINSVRITTQAGYLENFLQPYQPEQGFSTWVKADNTETLVKFPLETCARTKPLKSLADGFFCTDSNLFFVRNGFPDNSRGKFQALLNYQRVRRQNGFYVYYVPRFAELEPVYLDMQFWESFINNAERIKLPLLTCLKFMPARLAPLAFQKTLVESNQSKASIWEITTDLLLSRFYVGGYNIISELAMLLDVPCIILLPEGDQEFPLERKNNVQYVTRTHGIIDYEDFRSAYLCLERMLIPES